MLQRWHDLNLGQCFQCMMWNFCGDILLTKENVCLRWFKSGMLCNSFGSTFPVYDGEFWLWHAFYEGKCLSDVSKVAWTTQLVPQTLVGNSYMWPQMIMIEMCWVIKCLHCQSAKTTSFTFTCTNDWYAGEGLLTYACRPGQLYSSFLRHNCLLTMFARTTHWLEVPLSGIMAEDCACAFQLTWVEGGLVCLLNWLPTEGANLHLNSGITWCLL